MKISKNRIIYYTLLFMSMLFPYIITVMISYFFVKNEFVKALLTGFGTWFLSVFFIAKLDYKYSKYECSHCGSYFKPKFSEYFWKVKFPGPEKTEYWTCSKCGKKGWCKNKSLFDWSENNK